MFCRHHHCCQNFSLTLSETLLSLNSTSLFSTPSPVTSNLLASLSLRGSLAVLSGSQILDSELCLSLPGGTTAARCSLFLLVNLLILAICEWNHLLCVWLIPPCVFSGSAVLHVPGLVFPHLIPQCILLPA